MKIPTDLLDMFEESPSKKVLNRTYFLRNGMKKIKSLIPKIAPILSILFPFSAKSQNLNARSEVSILQYFLRISYLQNQFYTPALTYSSLIGKPELPAFIQIQAQVKAHINFFQNTIISLGASPISDAIFYDFTLRTALGQPGVYQDLTTNYETFLKVAQIMEDTVSRAYLGQISYLVGLGDQVNVISGIHSLHTRHAAFIRNTRAELGIIQDSATPPATSTPLKSWVTLSGITALGIDSVVNQNNTSPYNGEDLNQISQINLVDLNKQNLITDIVASESFDQPLTSTDALQILNSFSVPQTKVDPGKISDLPYSDPTPVH